MIASITMPTNKTSPMHVAFFFSGNSPSSNDSPLFQEAVQERDLGCILWMRDRYMLKNDPSNMLHLVKMHAITNVSVHGEFLIR